MFLADLLLRFEARAVVLHRDIGIGAFRPAGDNDMHRSESFAQAVFDGVFNQRLQRERRQAERGMPNVVIHGQLFTVTVGLHGYIGFGVPELIREGDQFRCRQGGKVGLQVFGEILHNQGGSLRIIPAEDIYGGQRVVDEMRPDLVHHGPDLCIPKLFLLLSQKPFAENRRAHEPEAAHIQIQNQPDQKNRGEVQRAGARREQQIRTQGQTQGKDPQQLGTGRLLLYEGEQMQHDHADSVPDQRLIQFHRVEELQKNQHHRRGCAGIKTNRAEKMILFSPNGQGQAQGQHHHQHIGNGAGKPDFLMDSTEFQQQGNRRQTAKLPDAGGNSHGAKEEGLPLYGTFQRKNQRHDDQE